MAAADHDVDNLNGRDPIAAEGYRRWTISNEALDQQRCAILEAKQFRAGNQWPQDVREQRQGAPAMQGVAAQPARPCLTIDRVSQPVRQVSNAVRQSNFEIDVIPVGEGADKATASIYKGWMRRVQNEARGDAPIEWAADSAAEGGIGWFRLLTYETNTDDQFPFDQDLSILRVPNSLSVYPDPYFQKPTGSDMRYLLVTEDLATEEAERLYDIKNQAAYDAFRAVGDTGGWVTDKTIRIAEYWRIEYLEERIVELNNGKAFIGDAIPKGAKKGTGKNDIKRERLRRKPTVKWSKITACEELESTEWMGTRIPFIPILGEELNVDGKRLLRGVIQPAMDAQRMVNYTYSAAVESAALAPKAPWLYAAGQIEPYKAIWQNSATTNYTGLPYEPIALLGQPVPPPTRNSVEQPIQAMVDLMVRSEDAVKSTTGIFDPSLGNTNPREKSGTAIKALQDQSSFGQSNYQDNVTRALIYAGELMVELGPKLLDRPGRIIQILQESDQPAAVMIGQPFVPPSGPSAQPQPIAGPDGSSITDPAHETVSPMIQQGIAKFYDLTTGKYGVVVNVGKDFPTKRMETNAQLGNLIPHLPPQMQAVLTPEFIAGMDFQDADKIANIARRALPPELQQAENGGPPQIPPAVQQQMQQMQQALQQAKQIIDTKQIEQNGALNKVKLEGTKDLLLAHVNNSAKILIAHITAGKEGGPPGDEGQLELTATGMQQQHEAIQADLDRRHEAAMSMLEHAQTMQQADQANTHALMQGQQAAALQPEPEPAQAGA